MKILVVVNQYGTWVDWGESPSSDSAIGPYSRMEDAASEAVFEVFSQTNPPTKIEIEVIYENSDQHIG